MASLTAIKAEVEELLTTGRRLLGHLFEEGEDAHLQFFRGYQDWYSTALSVVRVVGPDRLEEFEQMYSPTRKPDARVTALTYGISDWLMSFELPAPDTKYSRGTATAKFSRQVAILQSCVTRLNSSAANLRATILASLFDSEIDAAQHLLDNGHGRAAGAVAGVVLEAHLQSVCSARGVSTGRRKKTLGNLKEALRSSDVIDLPVARQIEALADIRNLCDHKRSREPTDEEVQRLVDQTRRYTKELH